MNRWACVLSLVLLSVVGCAPGETPETSRVPSDDLSASIPEAIERHMEFLADDALGGRGTGTPGYDRAAEYVADQFKTLGLEPAGEEGYYQPVSFRKSVLVADRSSLSLGRDGELQKLEPFMDYYLYANYFSEESDLTAPIVFAGFAVVAPEFDYDDFAGIDVKGKVVAIFQGAPERFPHNERAHYSSSQVKVRGLVERGAIGLLLLPTQDDLDRFSWDRRVAHAKMFGLRWTNAEGEMQNAFPEIKMAGVLNLPVQDRLFANAPRSLEQVLESKKKGESASFDLPFQVSAHSVSRLSEATSPNVIGRIPGRDPVLSREHVVLTTHLDHVGTSEPIDGDGIYNGAYDNASGTAVLIEAARALAAIPEGSKRSLLFLAVTGEEKGLLGSDYFANHPTVPADSIVANLNMDSVMMQHALKDVIAFGAEHSSLGRPLERAVSQLGIEVSPDPYPEEVIFIRSDQYSFVKKGVPSVYLDPGHLSGDPDIDGSALAREWYRDIYHTPKDDMNQEFNFEAGADFTRLIVLLTTLVANDPQRPTWNEGDFFGEKFAGSTGSSVAGVAGK